MSMSQLNARVNWVQVAAIIIPLLIAGFTFARSLDQRVALVEERINSHSSLATHPNAELRLSRLEVREAATAQAIRNIEANQVEIKVLLRDLSTHLRDNAHGHR